jgi:tight adherence protein C
MNSTFIIATLVIGLLLAGVLLIFIAYRTGKTTDTTDRLHEFVSYQSHTKTISKQSAPIQQQHFSELFLDRTVVAGFKKLFSYLGRFAPKQTIAETDRKLSIIRNPGNLRAREFFAVRLIFLILGIVLAFLINLRNFGQLGNLFSRSQAGIGSVGQANPQYANLMLLAGVLLIILFFLLPSVWLNAEVNKVKQKIEREFPDALDLLSVCADAGLGFDQAMQRVGEQMQNAIGAEFRRVSSEMEVGVSRADALRNMSQRLDVSELSSFVTIIIQSETLGMRIADVLHSQAEQFRIIRHFKAKEIAYKLPAKMIIPLALLILPALLIVILGPLIPRILTLLS